MDTCAKDEGQRQADLVRPTLGQIRPNSKHDVKVIAHHGEPGQVDRANPGQIAQPVLHPAFTVIEILPRPRQVSIGFPLFSLLPLSSQLTTYHPLLTRAARPDFRLLDNLSAGIVGHQRSP